MKNTVIIIPTRLEAIRFPNKPLAKINNVPMIIHVLNRAKESGVGEVFVATPDKEIFQIVNEQGGKAILTKKNHNSGSDRIYEVYSSKLENLRIEDFVKTDNTDADLVVTANSEVLIGLINREISPIKAYMSGDLKVKASLTDMLLIKRLF